MDELFTLADKLRALREEKDLHSALVKEIGNEIDEVEYRLTEAMAKAECGSFNRGEKQFIMTTTTRWSPEKDQKDALYTLLKEKGYEHLFTVNSQTLASFIKEQVEETEDENGETHIPEWLTGLVKSYEDIGITMKAATGTGKKSGAQSAVLQSKTTEKKSK